MTRGAITAATPRTRVSGRFDNDYVILRKLLCEGLKKGPAHVDALSRFELAVVPGDRLGEGAVDIQSDDAHAPSVFVRSKWKLAGDTTSTDPRSRRIRESRKGRPCNELGLSAHCLSAACPHLRAPGAPCPGWAHHIAVSLSGTAGQKGADDLIPDNGIVERFHKTVLDEFYRVVFRKKIYGSIAELQADLDSWVQSYNEERPHQGRWCFGKTPMQTFLDATPLAKEKMIAA